jgi:hypothetical protein
MFDWSRGDELITVRRRQHDFGMAMFSILMNIVILNFFVEHVDEVVIDSFSISVLTAILLTVMVALISRVEHRVHHFFFDEETGRGSKVLGWLVIWGILFGGKLLILEVVNWVFGDHVQLGHLLEVILLVLTMLVVQGLMDKLYEVLGRPMGSRAATDDVSS